jgi:hypothetical protein
MKTMALRRLKVNGRDCEVAKVLYAVSSSVVGSTSEGVRLDRIWFAGRALLRNGQEYWFLVNECRSVNIAEAVSVSGCDDLEEWLLCEESGQYVDELADGGILRRLGESGNYWISRGGLTMQEVVENAGVQLARAELRWRFDNWNTGQVYWLRDYCLSIEERSRKQ